MFGQNDRKCKNEIGRRVDGIVSNKYRGSYHKAAALLVAMAETLTNRDKRQQGLEFIEKYRTRYSRHSAFRRELKYAIQASGIYIKR